MGCRDLFKGPASHLMEGGRKDSEPWEADRGPHMDIRTVPNSFIGTDKQQWLVKGLHTRVIPHPGSLFL